MPSRLAQHAAVGTSGPNTRLVNLTPHPVRVLLADGAVAAIPPSGPPARCAVSRRVVGWVQWEGHPVPVHETLFGAVEDLPPEQPGTLLIVSLAVTRAALDRDDLLVPDDVVRNEDGSVAGCRAFSRPRSR